METEEHPGKTEAETLPVPLSSPRQTQPTFLPMPNPQARAHQSQNQPLSSPSLGIWTQRESGPITTLEQSRKGTKLPRGRSGHKRDGGGGPRCQATGFLCCLGDSPIEGGCVRVCARESPAFSTPAGWNHFLPHRRLSPVQIRAPHHHE